MTFRDLKNTARATLHDHLKVAALYLTKTGEDTNGDPEYDAGVEVTVRIHTDWTEHGDQKGTNFHFAERAERSDEIVFLASEITPHRGGVVSVETGEAYIVDNVLPQDGLTITAEVSRMAEADTVGLALPST